MADVPPTSRHSTGILTKIWLGLILFGVATEFALGLIGLVVYRDTSNYTLAGNPWELSNFRWHVIWGMRLLTIMAGLVLGPLAVGVVAVPIRLLLLRWLGEPAQKPAMLTLAYVLAVLLLLLLVARIGD